MEIICNTCGFTADAEDPRISEKFYLRIRARPPTRRSDWLSRCASCEKAYKKKWYEQNRERISTESREARYSQYAEHLAAEAAYRLRKAKNPGTILRRRAVQTLDPIRRYLHDRGVAWKASSRRRELLWGMTDELLFELYQRQGGRCFYTGRPLVLGPNSRETLSLDRRDSAQGYVPDNCVFCTHQTNLMKHELTIQEFHGELLLLVERAASWTRQ